jgi:peroxiredoxin
MVSLQPPPIDQQFTAPDFDLPGVDGKRYSLREIRLLVPECRGLLVMFICNHCPYVKAIRERLVRDTGELLQHGVASVAIMSNDVAYYPEDSFPEMKRVADVFHFPFPYIYDESQDVARAYDAVCTPDFFGFNKDLKLRYRGRLDASRKELVPDARRELFEAMVQVADTGEGPEQQTPPIGCSIKWRKSSP